MVERKTTAPMRRFADRLPIQVSLSLMVAIFGGRALADEVKRPNVVLIITDDQGYGDLGCHGNEIIQTPHLDRLHAQSVRLTDFHVDPTCSPTRASLMTGRYSSRTGVWHTIMGRSILYEDETTMADVFSSNGYQTAIFGKWHLGDNYPFRAQDRGFQKSLVHGGGGVGQTPDYWGNSYFDDVYFHDGRAEAFEGYCTDVFFDHAIRYIEEKKEQPFFVYLSTNAPHSPFIVEEKYSKPYADQGVPSPRDKFWGMITNIDENVGRLDRRLEELGLSDDTLLIFMTDNGTAAGYRERQGSVSGFNAGMRGTKGSQYDGGHRVPCFWRWPAGGIDGARDVEALTAHIDLLPTLIALCGMQPPADVQMDGISLAEALRDRDVVPERTLTVHSQRIEYPEKWRQCAVMTKRWRLVDGEQLFDMQADPGQRRNVADEHPAVVGELRDEYKRWFEDLSSRFDRYARIVLGADEAPVAELTAHDWHAPLPQVPWNQSHVLDPDFVGNGVWKVAVAREGKYAFTLRRRPKVADFPIDAEIARIAIGEIREERRLPPDAVETTFTLDLPAGEYDLQTWFETSATARGAYFVEARRAK